MPRVAAVRGRQEPGWALFLAEKLAVAGQQGEQACHSPRPRSPREEKGGWKLKMLSLLASNSLVGSGHLCERQTLGVHPPCLSPEPSPAFSEELFFQVLPKTSPDSQLDKKG